MSILLLIFFLIFVLAVLIGGLIFIYILEKKGRLFRSLNMETFLITLPKLDKTKEQKDFKETIGVMEQFFANLTTLSDSSWHNFLYGAPSISFELVVPAMGEEIMFYISVPRKFSDILEKQVHGFFPEASVEWTEEVNIFAQDGASAAAYLKLQKSNILPTRTYKELNSDPLQDLTNALSKLEAEGEGASVQIVARPAKGWEKIGLKVAKKMQQEGIDFEKAKSEIAGSWMKFFSFGKSASDKKDQISKSLTPLQQEIVKAIENKSSKLGFEVNIRLVASAKTDARAKEILRQIMSSFAQFTSPTLNSFQAKEVNLRKSKNFFFEFAFRLFNKSQKIILNTEELTSLYHFPNVPLETPKVRFLKARPSAPPVNLPSVGLVLGKNIYRGQESLIRISKEDRRRHIYVIGQTGTGKSNFIKSLVEQDIKNGEGVCVVDPHGDLVETILGYVPQNRLDDVIYFDPANLSRPMALNLFEFDEKYPEQKTFVINEFISILDKLYDLRLTGGPMFEQYFRNAALLVMEDPDSGSTLMEIPKVLSDEKFRAYKLSKAKNPVVRNFWLKEAEKAGGEATLANIVPYITSKLTQFLANDIMRPMIAQQKSSFNFREVMDQKKILLVNLSKGRIGDLNANLLGMIIVGKILVAAFSRADMSEEKRNDFYLYIDEFQNFTTDSIAQILSEARKYGLSLNIAHQFIKQLKDNIKDAVFGNVGSILSFRVGSEDAEFLQKQFEPIFSASDIVNLDNFNLYAKIMVKNQVSRPFSMITLPASRPDLGLVEKIREYSSLKYGRPKEEVEKEIAERALHDFDSSGLYKL
jgi:hypothetical protein